MTINIPAKVIEATFGKPIHGAIMGPETSTIFFKGETLKINTPEYFAEYLV